MKIRHVTFILVFGVYPNLIIETPRIPACIILIKAKEKLSTTNLSVSEIAYELGFEHSQSFSRLFKSKTNQSPVEFRAGFN